MTPQRHHVPAATSEGWGRGRCEEIDSWVVVGNDQCHEREMHVPDLRAVDLTTWDSP